MEAASEGWMYRLDVWDTTKAVSSRLHRRPTLIKVWHRRLGHAAIDQILRMSTRSLVDGLDVTERKAEGKCIDCIMGKHARRPFDEVVARETEILERIHLDLWGPSRTTSAGGKCYMLIITDGRTSYRVPYFLSNQEAPTTLEALRTYHVMAERQTGKKLKRIWVDKEFINGAWKAYCAEHGIILETGPHYSSAQNEMAEKSNRTVIEGARTILHNGAFPPSMWGEAASSQIYLWNFVPLLCHPDEVPAELWTGKCQDVSHLHPLGCDAWAKILKEKGESKLSPRSIQGKLIGYMGAGVTEYTYQQLTK